MPGGPSKNWYNDPGSPLGLLLFIPAFLYGAYSFLSYESFAMSAVEVPGKVTAIGGNRFVINYVVDGHRYSLEEKVSRTDRVPAGEAPVLYDPVAPEHGRWKHGANVVFPLAMMGIGAAGCATFVMRRRR